MDAISRKLNHGFIEEALVQALSKSCESDHLIVRVKSNPFDPLGTYQIKWDEGYIAKHKKGEPGNNFQSTEKHVLILNEVKIDWIKKIEKINSLHKGPKIFWWFGEANVKLRDEILDLLGEFRTLKINDDIKPKVTFFIESKKKELFHDFENE